MSLESYLGMEPLLAARLQDEGYYDLQASTFLPPFEPREKEEHGLPFDHRQNQH